MITADPQMGEYAVVTRALSKRYRRELALDGVNLQVPDGAGWRTVSTLEPGGNFDRAAFEFAPFVAERVRLFQPAQAGPQNRPFVMWVREVQAFGAAE